MGGRIAFQQEDTMRPFGESMKVVKPYDSTGPFAGRKLG